ncbi:lytic murein transglycosylase [Acuticoccus sp. M5D2P5]|uniref:lytic murein transglycosylase n=1 Tax=Acuticoccus kalidii TaxID=2910977 RepID=UPI001F443082|nr:lytic murein transglycosylase [Acuticoccus kalidii]MCF3932742.1 lytic murein transglycosylase [Acuticoccus kalidii]
MTIWTRTAAALALAAIVATSVAPANAASCGNSAAGFDAWLSDFKARAVAQGISSSAVNRSLDGVTYSSRVIGFDRNQKSFRMSYEDFYRRRVDQRMINRGRSYLRDNAGLIGRIEDRYGVPGALVVAVWALETGFGRDMGDLSIMRSLATLAYDCRRSDFFTGELLAALRIVDKGDMTPAEMKGAWAGEIGQTQFLAERYVNYAVDFDGNGKADLIRSVPDALASTANWFRRNGWRPGAPWGPGTANYAVIGKWNRAEVYQRTIAALADELAQ